MRSRSRTEGNSNRGIYALFLGAIAALAIAGCGGSDEERAHGGTSAEGAEIAVISAKTVGDLGEILVDSEGRTLYDFHKDKRTLYSAKSSACYGACTKEWVPLLTGGEPEAEDGAFPTKLSTFKRKDGTLQVTYYGHPLYTYVGDKKPGEANGNAANAFGGEWSTLHSDGSEPESAANPKKGAWGVVFGAEGEEFGIILYDLSGHTLYTFEKDKGGKSSCYGACAKTWPPALTEGKARAGGEAIPAKVGTTKRKDGTVQLTYAGHPLYTYSRDRSTETTGNGVESFGGEWYAIRPNGEKP